MAMTAVADTRFLLTWQFPPSREVKSHIEAALARELTGRLLAPSVVLTEFVKIAGSRIGGSASLLKLNLLMERGMKTIPVTDELALIAGRLLLSHPDIPIADALISAPVKKGLAEYVVTDDPHYRVLGVRTKWI
jgi:predicted nucleic acid-binding protein